MLRPLPVLAVLVFAACTKERQVVSIDGVTVTVPGDFVPIAEETGIITALGEWVLHGACREAARRPSLGRVAVNVSPIQLADPNFPELVESHLKRWGLQILQRASQEGAITLYLLPDGIDIRNELPNITQPALLIHGGKDDIIPQASSEGLLAALPNGRLIILHDAGHVPTVTRPKESTKLDLV